VKLQGARIIAQVSRSSARCCSNVRLGLKFRNHDGWNGKAGKRRWLVGPRQQHNIKSRPGTGFNFRKLRMMQLLRTWKFQIHCLHGNFYFSSCGCLRRPRMLSCRVDRTIKSARTCAFATNVWLTCLKYSYCAILIASSITITTALSPISIQRTRSSIQSQHTHYFLLDTIFVTACLITVPAFSVSFLVSPLVTHTLSDG
jgi:hypothetical protein